MLWFISKQLNFANRHSSMVCDWWKAPEDSVSHGLCKQRLGGVSSIIKLKYVCKQKRRGMIYLAGRDNVLHGSRSWKSGWRGSWSAHYHSLTTTNTSQNNFTSVLKMKSSSTWLNPYFPLRRAFLLLLCWVSFPILSVFHKQTLVLSLIHIWRCRRIERCRSRWSPYH